jgi:ParB family chromosome partitioning protein
MATNNRKGRDLSRLNMVSAEAGAGWKSLVSGATLPGERLEGARLLPVDRIAPAPGQPRKRFDAERLQSLADSILEDGVIQPIVVRPAPGRDGHYVIVAGERRWRAAQLARLADIPAVITEESDDAATARMMLRENTEREDLDIEDLGQYLRTLAAAGATQRELAALTHYSLGKVNGLLQLVQRPDLLEQIRQGRLTQESALELISGGRRATPRAVAPAPASADATLGRYRPLARLNTWAGAVKADRIPREERPALRAYLDETIGRLSALRDELGDAPAEEKDSGGGRPRAAR